MSKRLCKMNRKQIAANLVTFTVWSSHLSSFVALVHALPLLKTHCKPAAIPPQNAKTSR